MSDWRVHWLAVGVCGGWLAGCSGPLSGEPYEDAEAGFAAVGAELGGGEFVPNEQLVSPQRDLIDFEFSQARAQITWSDSTGKLWLGGVDPVNGMFKPINGKGQLLDPEALSSADMAVTFNGPEWLPNSRGIAYTKFVPNMPRVPATGRLALAEVDDAGEWTVRTMPGPLPWSPRLSPYTGEDGEDPVQRITYTDHQGTHFWRDVARADSEETLPLPQSVKSVRLANGVPAAIYTLEFDGVAQVVLYDLARRTVTQLTYDAGQKDVQTVPWMWRAPELDDAFVFMTVVDVRELRFYRLDEDPSGGLSEPPAVSLVHSVLMPENSKIASPQPFTYNGASYVFFALTEAPNNFPSTIWLSNIDASAPLLRCLNDGILRARSDPEMFVTRRGPFIYYNRYNQTINPDKPFCADCSEGVFRAFTGLPAPANR